MQYRILGPLEVESDGGIVSLRATKQRVLLALLLLHANDIVSTDRLIEELWGEDPPTTAENALRSMWHSCGKHSRTATTRVRTSL